MNMLREHYFYTNFRPQMNFLCRAVSLSDRVGSLTFLKLLLLSLIWKSNIKLIFLLFKTLYFTVFEYCLQNQTIIIIIIKPNWQSRLGASFKMATDFFFLLNMPCFTLCFFCMKHLVLCVYTRLFWCQVQLDVSYDLR